VLCAFDIINIMKPNQIEVEKYVKAQPSLRLYNSAKRAFIDVLGSLPIEDYKQITSNLIIMAMHEGATGQVMHFKPIKDKFAVLQLSIPKNIPFSALKSVIAHELGHVLQGKNWDSSLGDDLEIEADMTAERWGYPIADKDIKWLEKARLVPQKGLRC
jgi:hypothetical protein